jgi:tetratricopeptide (TPR) repeat protein
MRAALRAAVVVLVWGQLAVARAETCPEVPDDEVALRRSMAKEWFAKAEEAEASGDRQGAIRRYACSLNLAPHPSTAYNLGTVAEKSGDLAMALDGFRSYLKLAPEATDRPAIEARIAALEAKISDLRKEIAPAAAGAAPSAGPAPSGGAAAVPAAPPPGLAPLNRGPAVDGGGRARRLAAWITGAGAVAALGTGVAFNLVARSKMTTCDSKWAATQDTSALAYCDEAKPFAYWSYALFGVAGAAAAASALIFFSPTDPGAPVETAAPEVGLVPTTGGLAFVATGRF